MRGLIYHKTKNQIVMKIFITLFLFLSLLSCKKVSSQFIVKSIEDLETMVRFSKGLTFEHQKSYSNIEGTPYMSEDFKPGEVYTKDSILYEGPLRYNIYEDEIEFKANDKIYWIAKPQDIVYVKIEKSSFIFIHTDEKKNKKGSYYELLVGGKCQLLLKRNIVFLEAEASKPYIDEKAARFQMMKDTYFLQIDNVLPQSITNMKSIKNVISEKSSDISKYIKREKISAKEKDDLIKLVKYCNSL